MNIHFLITHSYGELDIIAPMINELRQKNKVKNITIIITVKQIYLNYEKDIFYKNFFLKKNVIIKFSPLASKFNKRPKNKYIGLIYKIFCSFFFIIKNIPILYSNAIFYEITNQISNDTIFVILNNFLKKKFFIYHHAHAIPPSLINYNMKRVIPKNYTFLAFSPINTDWYKSFGYKNLKLIGFPKLLLTWKTYINNYKLESFPNEYAVILTRPPSTFYLTKKNYKFLLNSSIKQIINLFPNLKILIKRHPREKSELIFQNLLKKFCKNKNIEIVDHNSALLARNAKFVISFWSSAILDTLIFKTPCIEYFRSHKKFFIVEPDGSTYKNVGFISTSKEKKLKSFLINVKNKKFNKVYKNVNILKPNLKDLL